VGAVEVDALMMQRCLQNLITNALRYGREVGVRLEREAGWVRVHVEDRGPGIDPAQLASIVEPFVRGKGSRNRAHGGYGLGLSIAQRIAASHGGQLMLVNREGGGLQATVSLPVEPEA